MSEFLSTMAESSRLRATELRRRASAPDLESQVLSSRPPVPLTLSETGFDLIAEAKLASPSEGRLVRAQGADQVVDLARGFSTAGAAVISVLTEPRAFGGEMSHLEKAAAAVEVPVMRKDFLVDPIQVIEARAAGASGVLLIARLLDRGQLVEMTDLALKHGMFALVELFDVDDLELASAVFDREILVGVNSRNLTSLAVDPGRHAELVGHLPPDLPLVAESGIQDLGDVRRVAALGYRLALVGSSLVKNSHPSDVAFDMIASGRTSLAERPVL